MIEKKQSSRPSFAMQLRHGWLWSPAISKASFILYFEPTINRSCDWVGSKYLHVFGYFLIASHAARNLAVVAAKFCLTISWSRFPVVKFELPLLLSSFSSIVSLLSVFFEVSLSISFYFISLAIIYITKKHSATVYVYRSKYIFSKYHCFASSLYNCTIYLVLKSHYQIFIHIFYIE